MRLLHSRTLEFEFFTEDALPPYVTLSHTWGNDEVSHREMCYLQQIKALREEFQSKPELFLAVTAIARPSNSSEAQIKRSTGYKKIEKTAEIARTSNCEYFWIDTCCIDKSSSAELQEAINSMYSWYEKSAICAVYLEDVEIQKNSTDSAPLGDLLASSRWITRGWTLQELVAPKFVRFYDRNWRCIASKRSAVHEVARATKIPENVLFSGDLARASVAQKMSWAAKRSTTRVEDRAYSLLGLFGIHMPMLYGEGERAFLRLQEEILKTTEDSSIFAWQSDEQSHSIYRGLLAKSPEEFKYGGEISRGRGWPVLMSNTNLGVSLQLSLKPLSFVPAGGLNTEKDLFLARLQASRSERSLCIVLRKLCEDDDGRTHYARVMAKPEENYTIGERKIETVYVRQQLLIPVWLSSSHMHCFHFRPGADEQFGFGWFIKWAWPSQHWSRVSNELVIPENEEQFLGVMRLEYHNLRGRSFQPLQIIFGYDRATCRGWCTTIPGDCIWPGIGDHKGHWRKALERHGPFSACGTRDTCITYDKQDQQSHLSVNVSMEVGLWQDRLSFWWKSTGWLVNRECMALASLVKPRLRREQ